LPVVGSNVQAARELASVGVDLARAGEQTATRVDPDRLQVVDGGVPLDEVRRVTPDFERAARHLNRAVRRLGTIDGAFLFSPVGNAVGKVDRELARASRDADDAVKAARLAPAIFGGEGTRRYLVVVQNPAESRATGGFPGFWGTLTGEDGKVRLDDLEPITSLDPSPGENRVLHAPQDFVRRYQRFFPERSWPNINMSPDFPTVAQVMTDQYQQARGEQVDGILAVDPEGLAALLRLTGPVSVAGWPEPLTADNVVQVTLNEAYIRLGNESEQEDFLRNVARTVVDRATSERLGRPAQVAKVLGRAAREGHLILAFTRPKEQALSYKLGVAGNVPAVRSDSILVTTQNARGNKIDYYLKRHIAYSVHLDPTGGGVARLNGRMKVTLENTAPDTGLPMVVIGESNILGPASFGTPGENGTYASVYTPLDMTAATFGENPQALDSKKELQRNVYAGNLSVPPRSSRTLAVDLSGTVHIDHHGWYTLDLVRQPNITPDEVKVSIVVPPGWRLNGGHGIDTAGGRQATAHVRLDKTTRLRVHLVPAEGNLWQRLLDGD
jgi:hypothetical protein